MIVGDSSSLRLPLTQRFSPIVNGHRAKFYFSDNSNTGKRFNAYFQINYFKFQSLEDALKLSRPPKASTWVRLTCSSIYVTEILSL